MAITAPGNMPKGAATAAAASPVADRKSVGVGLTQGRQLVARAPATPGVKDYADAAPGTLTSASVRQRA